MNKKVYFAGSIRGGRVDSELYHEIIEYIKRTDTVLTEHVGDISLNALEGEKNRDEAIYAQDTEWLKESDVLVAECTCPSLGVGYELAYAEKLGIPCFVFYQKMKCQLSAMIKGNSYYTVIPYETKDDVFSRLDVILGK